MQNEVKALAQQYPKIQSLMRYVNKDTLLEAYKKQPNSDMKRRYGEEVDGNLNVLLKRMKKMSYYPQSQLRYSESGSDKWKLKREFKVFEDEIVADVLQEILMSIYEVKGRLTISSGLNESKSRVNSRHKRILLPMLCEINLSRPMSDADKEELIIFLEENISDRKFMQYIKRFLQSGTLECGNILETDSRGSLSSMLIRIFLFHKFRGWLTSKRELAGPVMKFWIYGRKFSFAFWNWGVSSRFRQMLLSIQDELGVKINIISPNGLRNRPKTQYSIRMKKVKRKKISFKTDNSEGVKNI